MQIIDFKNRKLPFEFVERKGVGHPDTMCDAIAELASRYYSQYFYNKYGRFAHHWFDKVMLVGGESIIGYGKGELIVPYKVIFSGKCVCNFDGEDIPLMDIFKKAASDVMSDVLTGFDAEKHLVVIDETVSYQGPSRKSSRYRPVKIVDLVAPEDYNRVSNDCNMLSSFYPLSKLEDMVLSLENMLNSKNFKEQHPQVGSDIKIIGTRKKDKYFLLVNLPFVASYVNSYEEYVAYSKEVMILIEIFVKDKYGVGCELLFNPSNHKDTPYLTVLGSAGDSGDVGVVGRGNRINGLITPMRCMSIEAPAGKDSIDHTGKLYGIIADRISKKIYELIQKPVETYIFVAKGTSLFQPDDVMVKVDKSNMDLEMEKEIELFVENELKGTCKLTEELVQQGILLW